MYVFSDLYFIFVTTCVRAQVGSIQRLYNCYLLLIRSMKEKAQTDLLENRIFMFKWSDIFTRGLFFQRANTIKIQLIVLV